MRDWKLVKNPDGWRVMYKWVEVEAGKETGNTMTVEKEQVTEMGLPDEYMYQVKFNGAQIGRLHDTKHEAKEAAEAVIAGGPRKLVNSGFDWSKIF